MPIRSFLSSCSFWKFSILIMVPCSCAAISVISASAAEKGNGLQLSADGTSAQRSGGAYHRMLCLSQRDELQPAPASDILGPSLVQQTFTGHPVVSRMGGASEGTKGVLVPWC